MSESETEETKEKEGFGFWAILELMGHVKVAGYVTEEERFGVVLGRIDIPVDDEGEALTQYFGGASIYRLTPVAEDVARAFARRNRTRPVHPYELALPKPTESDRGDGTSNYTFRPKGDNFDYEDDTGPVSGEEEDWF